MTTIPDDLQAPLTDLLLAAADDKLILGHRNSDWTGLGPILEEDIAFSSIAQDEIAHALAIYTLVGEWTGRGPDDLAFGRAPEAYRCASIVEMPDDFDWAVALARQLFCDHFDRHRLGRMARSRHAGLAAMAGRLAAEEQIHVEHANAWVERLGTGGDASRARLQSALDRLAPYAIHLFEPVEDEDRLVAAGFYPPAEGPDDADMFAAWRCGLEDVLEAAQLRVELSPYAAATGSPGGRRGAHTEHLAELLTEMGEVYRLEPGAAW